MNIDIRGGICSFYTRTIFIANTEGEVASRADNSISRFILLLTAALRLLARLLLRIRYGCDRTISALF